MGRLLPVRPVRQHYHLPRVLPQGETLPRSAPCRHQQIMERLPVSKLSEPFVPGISAPALWDFRAIWSEWPTLTCPKIPRGKNRMTGSGPAEITVFHPAAWEALDGAPTTSTSDRTGII
ncbi:hypothetical protein BDW62DRAFT_40012 [Aspergillus aurantiobrunneus]